MGLGAGSTTAFLDRLAGSVAVSLVALLVPILDAADRVKNHKLSVEKAVALSAVWAVLVAVASVYAYAMLGFEPAVKLLESWHLDLPRGWRVALGWIGIAMVGVVGVALTYDRFRRAG